MVATSSPCSDIHSARRSIAAAGTGGELMPPPKPPLRVRPAPRLPGWLPTSRLTPVLLAGLQSRQQEAEYAVTPQTHT